MEVDRTVDVALRQERLQNRKSVMRSDRHLQRVALPCASQSSRAGALSRSLTKFATHALDAEFCKAENYMYNDRPYNRIASDKWLVTFVAHGDGDSSSDEEGSSQPQPKSHYQ